MKKFICIVLMIVVGSFSACKKAEDKKAQQGKQQTTGGKQTKAGQKRQKRPKAGGGPAIQIYEDKKLAVSIPRAEYTKLMTTPIKVNGKDYKGVLLSDLLKQNNVSGKTIVLKGPAKSATVTWEQFTANPIYVYPFKHRLQLHHESKALADKIPMILVRITVGDTAVAAEAEKGTKKPAT